MRIFTRAALAAVVFSCSVALAGPPANDECGDAAAASLGKNAWDSTNATNSGPDPVFFTDIQLSFPLRRDVWFKWTATCGGTATFSLCQTGGFDSSMVLYKGGTCGALVELASDDCTCTGFGASGPSEIADYPVAAGDSFLIRVGTLGQFSGSIGGPGTLEITRPECVPAVSEWGMASIMLLLLTGLTIKFGAMRLSRKAA